MARDKSQKQNNERKTIDEIKYKNLFKDIFDSLDDPVFLYDLDDNFLYVNNALARTYGLETNEIIGKHLSEIVPEHQFEIFLNEHEIIKQTLETIETEYQSTDANGILHNHMTTVKPVKNSNGDLIGIVGIGREISKLRLNFINLDDEKIKLNLINDILMNAPDMIFFINEENKYEFVNKKYAQVHGKKIEDILGKENIDLFDRDTAKRLNQSNDQMRETLKEIKEVTYLNDNILNNKRIITETIKRPFIDEKGNYRGIIGISRDITREKILEQNFQNALRIESLVYMANSFSHDFNNLLGGILGYTEILMQNEALKNDLDSRTYLENITKIVDKGKSIIARLLSVSDQGKITENLIDVNSTITDVIAISKKTFKEPVNINVKLQKDLFLIKGDYNQIFQMFFNLLSNAIEALTNGGSINITTKNTFLKRSTNENEFISIKIKDTGKGIEQDALSRIFDPFYTTKDAIDNRSIIGLGLTIVYRIVKNHNGFIEVESTIGEGSTFTVHLPGVSKSDNTVLKSTKIQDLIKEKTIMVIDDSSDLLDIMKINFSQIGINGIFFDNPLKAIEKFKTTIDSIGLVIIDYLMPQMNGLEFFRELKKYKPDIKGIIITGYAKEVIKIKEEGILEILQKPLDFNYLTDKILNIVNY